MNLKQNCVIYLHICVTLCTFCRRISAKGLCPFEDMFPTRGKEKCLANGSFGEVEGVSTISPCPLNMVLGNCAGVATCENPLSEKDCSSTAAKAKACVCPDGFLMKGEQCVPLGECGCFLSAENKVISNNATYINDNCTRRCVCEDEELICEDDYQCSLNAECEVENNVHQCYCKAGFVGDGQTCTVGLPTDCFDIFSAGVGESGIYTILPSNWLGLSPFEVYCNMENGGEWTVFQRRLDGSIEFYRGWEEYKQGFGSLAHEFWLGNDKIASLTNQRSYELRIDLVNAEGSPYNAMYTLFRISTENHNYTLTDLGNFTGTAGYDAMDFHKGQPFSTYDRDNDLSSKSCAEYNHGAWWYGSCQHSNLNGNFVGGHDGIRWFNLPGDDFNIQYTEMRIRPTDV